MFKPVGALACAILLTTACAPARDDRVQALAAPPPAAAARGVVESGAGLIKVGAAREGLVTQVDVEEGDPVAAGQVLAILDDRQSQLHFAIDQAELAGQNARVGTAEAKLSGARRDLERVRRLIRLEAATTQEVDQAITAEHVAAGEAEEAVQAARVAMARARLSQAEIASHTIRAPAAGLVLRRMAVAGGSATAASTLFVIAPDGGRVVRAELDESLSDRVQPGMAAMVSREFDEGAPQRAHVLRVSESFSGALLNDDPAAQSDSRVLNVILALDGRPAFRLGQRVLVRFTK
ncbi:efflux RND transporter periplasmic adaptor subunit [Phenylobacterium sp.]|uniref:efflux RND transporter periplasmic adaptor subunit n=1 Tax=Phenylobacterium sp. TaxID=1871053 RepID=UPI003BAC80FC